MSRRFHLGDVLSVTTGKLVSPRLIEGVYDILNYMTGDDLYTHQLPRALRECRPYLLRQHPALAMVDAEAVAPGAWKEWLAAQVAAHGSHLHVEPIPMDDHARRDPLKELSDMVGPDRVVVVDPDDIEPPTGATS